MNKVVVTGGAGFIGSHLVKELLTRGAEVSIIDDLSTGKVENVPKETDFVCAPILDYSTLKDLFANADCVFHLAAIASVPESVKDPVTTNEVNVEGTLKVLGAAKIMGVKKVVLASSSAVYGNATSEAQGEELPPCPISPYASSKLEAEKLCQEYSNQYNLPTVCLRYFNVYGPGQNPNSQYALVIPAFINRAKQGLPLIIYGNGKQKRDFVFIIDVVNATIHLAESDLTGTYNVGSGKAETILKLANIICGLTNSQSSLFFDKPREGDPERTCADISKLVKTGFKPKYSLEEGLRGMVSNGY